MDEFGDDADLATKFLVTLPMWMYVLVVTVLERHYASPAAATLHSDSKWRLNF
jgi:hypothetical protein